MKPGIVVHACNPSYWAERQEDHKFEASLDNLAKPCLKILKRRMQGIAWW
jgi:hypothetical protein